MSEANPSIWVSASSHVVINIVTLVIGAVTAVDTGESHSSDSNARIAPPVIVAFRQVSEVAKLKEFITYLFPCWLQFTLVTPVPNRHWVHVFRLICKLQLTWVLAVWRAFWAARHAPHLRFSWWLQSISGSISRSAKHYNMITASDSVLLSPGKLGLV